MLRFNSSTGGLGLLKMAYAQSGNAMFQFLYGWIRTTAVSAACCPASCFNSSTGGLGLAKLQAYKAAQAGFNSSTGGLGLVRKRLCSGFRTCFNSSTGGLGHLVITPGVQFSPGFNSSTGGLGRGQRTLRGCFYAVSIPLRVD